MVDDPADECDCAECLAEYHPLGKRSLAKLEKAFADGSLNNLDDQWQWTHRDNADDWRRATTGQPNGRSIFERHRHRLRSDFGVSLWWTHTQDNKDEANAAGRASVDDIFRSTVAYLVLRIQAVQVNTERASAESEDEDLVDMPSENSQAVDVIPSSKPSERGLLALKRAFQILGLSPPARSTAEVSTAEGKAPKREPWEPRLRLLVSTSLEGDG